MFPPDLFEQILHQWQERFRTVPAKPSPPAKLDIIAFDGKSQRGSFPTKGQKLRPMVVNAMDLGTGRAIGTNITEPSSNEIPAAKSVGGFPPPRASAPRCIQALHHG